MFAIGLHCEQEPPLTQRNRVSTLSVEIMQNAGQMFDVSRLKGPQPVNDNPQGHSKITDAGDIWQVRYDFLLVFYQKYAPML